MAPSAGGENNKRILTEASLIRYLNVGTNFRKMKILSQNYRNLDSLTVRLVFS